MNDPQTNDQYRPQGDLDIADALSVYAGPWNPRLAAHLLRRAGFGGSPADIAAAAAAGMDASVGRLLAPSADRLPVMPSGDLSFGPMVDPKQKQAAVISTISWWLDRMLQTPNPLVERMTYFWHNHFTSAIDGGVTPALMVQQNNLYRQNALGNFAKLTHAVSQDPAMLYYLNGNQNRKQHPNENYARELMELFTLGIGNYTEQDVRESARSFSGWTVTRDAQAAEFVPRLHDDGSKTFLGHTGDFDGDDIVDIIMQQPACAQFMATKFLRNFVYDDPEPQLVDAVADRFRSSGYDVGQLLGVLLRSNLFYSPRAYRSIVKAPVDLVVGTLRTLGVTTSTPRIIGAMSAMNQTLMRPPNVAGWPGGSQWLNQGTILARLNFLNQLVSFHAPAGPAPAAAGEMMSSSDAAATAAMNAMPDISGPTAWLSGIDISDPGSVTERVISMAVQDDATEQQRSSIMVFLQTDSVGNQVVLNGENIDEKARGAMSLAMAFPAYELM